MPRWIAADQDCDIVACAVTGEVHWRSPNRRLDRLTLNCRLLCRK